MKPSIVIVAGIVVASCLPFHEALGEPIRVFPKIDTFLSSPRPDGLGDGARTCCDANPVPDGELISSHNVMEVDTNQGGGGPVEPLMWFDIQPALLDRFGAAPGATATFELTIVNGVDPVTVRRVTVDWLTIEGGGSEISRNNFPGAPDDLMASAFVPGVNIVSDSTTIPNPAMADQVQGTTRFDITVDVFAWSGGEPNYGWAFSPGASQGGTIVAVENEELPAPLLDRIGAVPEDLPKLRPSILLSGPDGGDLAHPFSGDFNRDGTIDFADFQILTANFGTGRFFSEGDNNFDGEVNLHDFVEFRKLFQAQQQGAAAAVPEPTSMCLFAMGMVALLGCIRQCGAHRARG